MAHRLPPLTVKTSHATASVDAQPAPAAVGKVTKAKLKAPDLKDMPSKGAKILSGNGATALTANTRMSAEQAVKLMKSAVQLERGPDAARTTEVALDKLPAKVAKKIGAWAKKLEEFTCRHSDLGNTNLEIVQVSSAKNGKDFVGYAVWALGGDDRGGFSAHARALFAVDGELLDSDTRMKSISDNEPVGDWDPNAADPLPRLRDAVTLAKGPDAKLTTEIDPATLPKEFATRVAHIQKELEKSTYEYADNGCTNSVFVRVNDTAGKLVGYALYSEGSDDADRWSAQALAFFAPNGLMVDRQITSTGASINA